MEVIGGLGIYPFKSAGRIYGLFFGIRGQAFVIGASQRGIFYRFRARIYSPIGGRFESIFALKTSVAGVDIAFKKWLRDETIPLYFRHNWIRGTIIVSRHGLHSFQLFATDPEVVNQFAAKDYASLEPIEEDSYYKSNTEKWK